MKKKISFMLALAMLLGLAVTLAVPAAAIDGQWVVYGPKDQYLEGYEGDMRPVPGYEYTKEGLKVIPADWRDFKPVFGVQTKEPVDLRDGVYMLIRIDEFTYANDKWFNLSVWDEQYVAPGNKNTSKFGAGLQALIRPSDYGDVGGAAWYINGFDACGTSYMPTGAERKDAEGHVLLALTITWDGKTYAVDINGAQAPAACSQFLNEHFPDGQAYIGFNTQNANKGGTAACTVLKFGTSKAKATAPMGDDSKKPDNTYLTLADIAEPDTVEPGKPGVFMNANREYSDSKTNMGKLETGSMTEDFAFHVVAQDAVVSKNFQVKNEVSYAIEDFPVALALTRNLCTCDEETCMALETAAFYMMAGDIISATDAYQAKYLNMPNEPIVKGEDSYLYFYVDMKGEDVTFDATGRINGVRFDVLTPNYQEAGKNAFDICFIAFFRNVEEAEQYVYDWLGMEKPVETTETESETVTEAPTAESETEEKTTETENPAQTEEKNTEKGTEEESKGGAAGGCASVLGMGSALVIVLVGACGVVSFRKKNSK